MPKEDVKMSMQLWKSDKDLLEAKRKELGLISVAEVMKRLVKYIDKVK